MDKKNTTIGLLLIGIAFYLLFNGAKNNNAAMSEQQLASGEKQAQMAPAQNAVMQPKAAAEVKTSAKAIAPNKEEIFVLDNGFIKVDISNLGASIKQVELLKHKKEQSGKENLIMHANDTVRALAVGIDAKGQEPVETFAPFVLTAKGKNAAEYEAVVNGIKIIRKFWLDDNFTKEYSPYTVFTSTKIVNLTGSELKNKQFWLSLGMAFPTEGDIAGRNLEMGAYDGNGVKFVSASSVVGSAGFMGFMASDPKQLYVLERPNTVWATVKNQPFAALFTSDSKKADKVAIKPVQWDINNPDKLLRTAIEGFMAFPIDTLANNGEWELSGSYYIGPKDIYALQAMGKEQDLAMSFGWLGFVSKPLLMFLNVIHALVGKVSVEWAWGWSIIILTILVRLVVWPLMNKQYRSSMRMAMLAEPIKKIKEKFKNDPQKVQKETWALYGEYGINPMAGCLPALIQLPIFLGLYFMLQSVGDFRFAHFLWIKDLSLPDTLPGNPAIMGIPIHLLPIINGLFTIAQMFLTPMTVSEPSQKFMIRGMPIFFLVLFYSFPSGLLLYWTVQSMFGFFQVLYVRCTRESLEEIKSKAKPKKGPSFMEKLQKMAEEGQRIRQEQERTGKKPSIFNNAAAAHERKKNPGGRSTPPKR